MLLRSRQIRPWVSIKIVEFMDNGEPNTDLLQQRFTEILKQFVNLVGVSWLSAKQKGAKILFDLYLARAVDSYNSCWSVWGFSFFVIAVSGCGQNQDRPVFGE